MPTAQPPPSQINKTRDRRFQPQSGVRSGALETWQWTFPFLLAHPGWQSHHGARRGAGVPAGLNLGRSRALPSHRRGLQQGKELKLQGSMTKLLSLPLCWSALRKGSTEKDSVLRSPASWRTDCRPLPSPGHGHGSWALAGTALISVRMDGPTTPMRSLTSLLIRSMILPQWVGGQKPTLTTLFPENINKWWSFLKGSLSFKDS